jgi:hypothetical protein
MKIICFDNLNIFTDDTISVQAAKALQYMYKLVSPRDLSHPTLVGNEYLGQTFGEGLDKLWCTSNQLKSQFLYLAH